MDSCESIVDTKKLHFFENSMSFRLDEGMYLSGIGGLTDDMMMSV